MAKCSFVLSIYPIAENLNKFITIKKNVTTSYETVTKTSPNEVHVVEMFVLVKSQWLQASCFHKITNKRIILATVNSWEFSLTSPFVSVIMYQFIFKKDLYNIGFFQFLNERMV